MIPSASLRHIIALAILAILLHNLSGCASKKPSRPDIQPFSQLPDTPESFSTVKKNLYEKIYQGNKKTFYCGCKFTATKKVYLGTCDVSSIEKFPRAKKLEAEHVFPAYHFGQHFPCWREENCTNNAGTPIKGRDCCMKTNPLYKKAHNDMHNLFPAIGKINGDRSHYNWGMIPGEKREYGKCDIEIDSSIRRAEPPDHVKGNIARVYFYMSETYNIRLSEQDKKMLQAWHKLDPPDDWERERNRRIEAIQGNKNRFIGN